MKYKSHFGAQNITEHLNGFLQSEYIYTTVQVKKKNTVCTPRVFTLASSKSWPLTKSNSYPYFYGYNFLTLLNDLPKFASLHILGQLCLFLNFKWNHPSCILLCLASFKQTLHLCDSSMLCIHVISSSSPLCTVTLYKSTKIY